jgi:hypothetical protein
MENLGLVLSSIFATSFVFYIVYLHIQFRNLKNRTDIQDSFILNLRKDIENLHSIIEKTEDAFQNDIRRHIEDLREDFTSKTEKLDTKNMYDYLHQASVFFNSFVDKNKEDKK